MKVIEPSYDILSIREPAVIMENLERIARTCYKSEYKGDPGFLGRIISRGHEAMIEHESITARFIHNRGFSHELVRHRTASYAQESTRYANYANERFGSELTFIEPYWFNAKNFDEDNMLLCRQDWYTTCRDIEEKYMAMVSAGLPPQAARGILPNDIKTEIVITANIREWRHIFYLRCAGDAHPDMRRVMIPLREELTRMLPVLFPKEEYQKEGE